MKIHVKYASILPYYFSFFKNQWKVSWFFFASFCFFFLVHCRKLNCQRGESYKHKALSQCLIIVWFSSVCETMERFQSPQTASWFFFHPEVNNNSNNNKSFPPDSSFIETMKTCAIVWFLHTIEYSLVLYIIFIPDMTGSFRNKDYSSVDSDSSHRG